MTKMAKEMNLLKSLRETAGLTQSEIAIKLGTHTQFVSNIEREICPLPARHIKILAKIFHIPPEILIERQLYLHSKKFRKSVEDAQ